ncbi:hypothetical protein GTY49_21025 [Streptomyces sp. SID5477]|nr:hypothetical protein [Streptomyces sp. SID5477]
MGAHTHFFLRAAREARPSSPPHPNTANRPRPTAPGGPVGSPFTSGSPARRPRVTASRRLDTRGLEKRGTGTMESGPAIFAGVVFALFGAGLLAWTTTRLRHGRPVALGVSPVASATVASVAAVIALGLGAWCLTRV